MVAGAAGRKLTHRAQEPKSHNPCEWMIQVEGQMLDLSYA